MSKRHPAARRSAPQPSTARSRQAQAASGPPKPATAQTTSGIKVRATQTGYYDHARRREGDVFLIASARDFSEKWMEDVDPRTPERLTTGDQELRKKHDEIMRDRMPAKGTRLVDDAVDNPLHA